MGTVPTLPSAFTSWQDGLRGLGKTPVFFQLIAADGETNLLPEDLYMILHVNPQSMRISPQKNITNVRTKGGYVEFHWGDGVTNISFDQATGGFMRLTSGLSNKTGSSFVDSDQSKMGRRETLAYDSYLDLLGLFKNNGATYDSRGTIASQGYVKFNFDGMSYLGWFDNASVTEDVSRPYQFAISSSFTVEKETVLFRTTIRRTSAANYSNLSASEIANEPIFDAFVNNRNTV